VKTSNGPLRARSRIRWCIRLLTFRPGHGMPGGNHGGRRVPRSWRDGNSMPPARPRSGLARRAPVAPIGDRRPAGTTG
jgi:hypothetical protein